MLTAASVGPEDAVGLSSFVAQKQTSIRFGLAPTPQSSDTILSPVIFAQQRDAIQSASEMPVAPLLKPDSAAQSLATAVDALVGETEEPFLASLTDDDYKRLVACLDKLIDVVEENENHLFAPLVDFIADLIEKYEEDHDMKKLLLGRGLRAAYNADEPEYTPAQLNLIKSQYQNPAQEPTAIQMTESRSPGRGLRAAYNADEPEYTPAQLNLIKSQYQNPAEK